MSKFYLLLIITCICPSLYGQLTSNYAFSTSADASLNDMSSGTTLLVAPNTDGLNTGIFSGTNPIGFTFYFMSMPYDQFVATEDGGIRLGSSLAPINRIPELTLNEPRIVAFACDMRTGSNGKVHYKTTGVAPNRVMTIEWQNVQIAYNSTGTGNSTFQIRLYETTGKIEYVYGYMYAIVHRGGQEDYGAIGFGVSNVVDKLLVKSGSFANTIVQNTSPPYEILPALITAVGEISGLSSSTDGARRIYTFTPRTAPADPTNLTYSGITQSSVTLHWVDNATNETNYHIYRSDDGGVNYELALILPENSITSGPISGLPDKTYHWKIYAVNEGSRSNSLDGFCTTQPSGIIFSTPAGGLWSQTTTWVGGVLPGVNDDVIIRDGATVTIDIPTAVCNNLTIGEGSSGHLLFIGGVTTATLACDGDIWVKPGATFDIENLATAGTRKLILGQRFYSNSNLRVDGVFDMNIGGNYSIADVEFRGVVDGTISGTGATCDFYSITVNKGTTDEKCIEATRIITMNSPSGLGNMLTLTKGTFKLSSASTLTPWYGQQTICPANTRIWINHASGSIQCVGTATVTGAGDVTINGKVQVTAGTFGYGGGANTCTVNGTLEVDGPDAIVNIFGKLYFAGAGYCNIFDGNVNVDPQAGANMAAGRVIEFPSLSTVIFSGGTLTIVDPNANAGSSEFYIQNSEQNKFFTGATIRFGNGVSSTTGNASGFTIAVPGGYGLDIGNVVVNNPAGTNRSVRMTTTSAGTPTVENLTILAGTFDLNGVAVNVIGDDGVVNNGTLLATAANSRINFSGTSVQEYTGGGTLSTTNLTTQINNPSGVTLNDPFLTTALILTSGLLNTTTTNLITVTGITVASITGSSVNSYVNGPLARNIVNGANTWIFPVGKSGYTYFEIINPATAGTVLIQSEVFDANAGGNMVTPPGYELNTNRYWNSQRLSGASFTSATYKIYETNLTTNMIITQCASQSGTYVGIHGSQAGSSITSVAATPGLGFFCAAAPGFLSGTYNVGVAQPFTSLTNNDLQGFFRAVNSSGLKGDVILKVTSDLTETGTIALNEWAESNGSGFTITIIPDGTTLKTISGVAASAAPLISINGADRFKIDGISNYLLFRNTRATANQTGPTIQFNNSSRNCKISNCIIESNATTATTGVIFFGAVGTNYDDTISHCHVRNSTGGTTGTPANAIYSNTSTNSALIISDNDIYNWSSYGVYFGNSGVNMSVTGNHFYNNLAVAPSVAQVAIYIIGNSGNGHIVSNNFIGGKGANCSGTAWVNSGNITFKGISISSGAGTANTIDGNTIQNISLTATGNVYFNGIEIAAGPANVGNGGGNLIGHATNANSIVSAGQQVITGIYSNTTASVSLRDNIVANITSNATTPSANQILRGIHHANTGSANISNNQVFNLSSNSIRTDINAMACQGIYYSGASVGSCFITENQIYNLRLTNVGANQVNIAGISVTAVSNPVVNRNKIWDIRNASTGVNPLLPPTASGITVYRPAASSVFEIRNNMISLGATLTTNTEFNGIWLQSSTNAYTANCNYNTVGITGTVGAGALNSFAFLRGDNSTITQGVSLSMRNNIFANSRSGGTGKHFAMGNQGTAPTTNWTATSTNYNFYVGSAASNIALWNAANWDIATLRSTTSGDASSISAIRTAGASDYTSINTANLFVDAANGDVHINTTQPEAWFVNGKGIQHTLNNDIDNASRSTTIADGSTDIGADEFTPTSIPIACGRLDAIVSGSPVNFVFANKAVGRITFTGASLPTEITILYYTQTFPDLLDGFGMPYPNLVGSKYSNCVWDITPTGGNISGYAYDLLLYYDDAFTGTLDDLTASSIAKNPYRYPLASSPVVDDYGVYPSTYTAATKSYLINGVVDFSKFILYQGTATPLPVNLVSFTAECNGNDVLVKWSTLTEINNDFFTLEKSYDGNVFYPVTMVEGAGNSNRQLEYSIKDIGAVSESKLSYYRLEQTDFDGTTSMSEVIAVECDQTDKGTIDFGFTPGQVVVSFKGLDNEKYSLQMFDNLGRLMYQSKGQLDMQNVDVQINISNFKPGVYNYVVTAGEVSQTKQIMIVGQ